MAYIFGRNPIKEYIKSGRDFLNLYIQKGDLKGNIKEILEELGDSVDIKYVDKRFLDKLTDKKNHQGIVGEIEDFKYSSLDEIISDEKNQLILLLDRIEDPHNLGAIVRTAEACGVSGIIIPKNRASDINDTVFKTSAGAINYMKVAKLTNLNRAIDDLKDRGFWIYGADLDGEDVFSKFSFSSKVCLVIGNEGRGISRLIKENCDFLVKIPMYGRINSLNASTSAGILMYKVMEDFKRNA